MHLYYTLQIDDKINTEYSYFEISGGVNLLPEESTTDAQKFFVSMSTSFTPGQNHWCLIMVGVVFLIKRQ